MNKKIIFLCLLAFIFSCENNKESYETASGSQKITDCVILVIFDKNLSVHWDNENYDILEDSLFHSFSHNWEDKKIKIAEKIIDITPTLAYGCPYERNLVVGDIAFWLLMRMEMLPMRKLYSTELDFFSMEGCGYPVGLFEFISIDRQKYREKL
ncbi:MAG: hypothetical protein R3B93_26025 [Bacteroidia bacterium]